MHVWIYINVYVDVGSSNDYNLSFYKNIKINILKIISKDIITFYFHSISRRSTAEWHCLQ